METHAREIAMRLGKLFDVTVLTSNPGRELSQTEELDGVHVQRVPTWPKTGDPFVPLGWSKALRDLRPDAVIIDGYQSVVSARALMYVTRHRIPSILVFHEGANSNRLRQALYPLQRRVLSRWFRKINKTIATAPHELVQYQQELKLSAASLSYIPNGADLPRPEMQPSIDPFKIVSLGRLEPQKRHDLVINALDELRHDGNPWSLVIIGQGDEESTLLQQADELGLSGVVRVTAFDGNEREKMAGELLSARLVIAPSLYETHPMAVVEAALLGCHVLVPIEGNPGVTDLAERGIAEAVVSSTAHQLAESLREASTRTFMVNHAELSTWDDCADMFVDMLRELVKTSER